MGEYLFRAIAWRFRSVVKLHLSVSYLSEQMKSEAYACQQCIDISYTQDYPSVLVTASHNGVEQYVARLQQCFAEHRKWSGDQCWSRILLIRHNDLTIIFVTTLNCRTLLALIDLTSDTHITCIREIICLYTREGVEWRCLYTGGSR